MDRILEFISACDSRPLNDQEENERANLPFATASDMREICANGINPSNIGEGISSMDNLAVSNAPHPVEQNCEAQLQPQQRTPEKQDGVGPTLVEDTFRGVDDYLEKKFQYLVSVVRNASTDFLIERFRYRDLEESGLSQIFEEIRKDAVYSRVNKVDEIILFAAAEMFKSPSKQSHWYGPRLASELLITGNMRVRYTLTRLILHGMQANSSQQMVLDNSSMDSLLRGLAAVLTELYDITSSRYDFEKNGGESKGCENENTNANEEGGPAAIQRKWGMIENNLFIVSKIIRSFFSNVKITRRIIGNSGILDAIASLAHHPKVSVRTMTELMKIAARNPEVLFALDQRDRFGCTPQIIINLAYFCIAKKLPKWSAPRFIEDGDLKEEDINVLTPLLVQIMKDFALRLTQESFFLEAFCSCVSELFLMEGTNESRLEMGMIASSLLEMFPKAMPLTDHFMARLIPLLKTNNVNLRLCTSQILTKIVREHPELIGKYKDSINAAASSVNR